MIHHVSIAARDPQRVAAVFAELLGGYSGPFVGPMPGAFVAYAEDDFGTGIEVYPEDMVIEQGETMGKVGQAPPPSAVAFHALLSVKVDRAGIERIGAREGWRVQHDWRGPKGGPKLFELYELWVENRVMFELATPDMLPAYVALTRGSAQQALLARLRPARPEA